MNVKCFLFYNRPNTGRSFFEETKTDLLSKYVKVLPEKAEKGWKTQYEMTKKHCIHGTYCNNKSTCLGMYIRMQGNWDFPPPA